MDSIDYNKLYSLQDKVLDTNFKNEKVFYLTGGTCLNRFYYEKRYSDDLDFFTHNDKDFVRGYRHIRKALKDSFKDVKEEVNSRDFIRVKIDNLLQVDFVNDRVERYKDVVYLENGYIIDNCENIFVNKITAIMIRDNPKDIFSLYTIDKFNNFNLKDLIQFAHKKANFSNDDFLFLIRLKTFSFSLIEKIVFKNALFLDEPKREYLKLVKKFERVL